jgi:hypothetical protein
MKDDVDFQFLLRRAEIKLNRICVLSMSCDYSQES